MLVLGISLLPVLALLFYIYFADRGRPEPPIQLIKAFLFGVASIFVSLFVFTPAITLLGLDFKTSQNMVGQFAEALFGAALPEETAKLIMLWLLLRSNKFYDEYFDGIVYAAFVGLGFAAFENLVYVMEAGDNWLYVGASRAIFSVPGHFCFAVAMGYFYSLVHFGQNNNAFLRGGVLLVPVIAHWIYDGLLFAQGVVGEMLALAFILVFLVFVIILYRRSVKLIASLKEYDTPPPLPQYTQYQQVPPPPPPTIKG